MRLEGGIGRGFRTAESGVTSARYGVLFFLAILTCQFGSNMFLSVGMLSTFLLLFVAGAPFLTRRAAIFLMLSATSFLSFLIVYQPAFIEGWLRESRAFAMGLFFFLVLAARPMPVSNAPVIIAVSASILATFCLVQFYAMAVGSPFFLPSEWYVNEFDPTLVGEQELLLLQSGYSLNIRPSGFYSEPSYCGLIAVALLYLSLSMPISLARRISITACLATVFLVQSVLGLAGVFLIYLSSRQIPIRTKFIWSSAAFVVALLFLAMAPSMIPERASRILTLSDLSMLDRLIEPLKFLGMSLERYPLGFPATFWGEVTSSRSVWQGVEITGNNALYNMIASYGFLGVPVIALMMSLLRNSGERVLLLVFLVQNGAFFVPDKVFVFSLVILVSRGISSAVREGGVTGPNPRRKFAPVRD